MEQWRQLAHDLLDHERRPAAVLDAGGKVVMTNRAHDELFRPLPSMRPALWTHVAGSEGPLDLGAVDADRPLRAVLHASPAEGPAHVLAVEVSRLHAPASYLLVVTSVRALPRREGFLPAGGVHYEIQLMSGSFGNVTDGLGTASQVPAGARCYQYFLARGSPCPGCPALDLAKTGSRSSVAFGLLTAPTRVGAQVLALARRRGERATVSRLTLDHAHVSALVRARIDAKFVAAGLSAQERRVLDLVILGRTADEIASVLSISARTAKFHQRNALTKLGAESRLDLLRVLL